METTDNKIPSFDRLPAYVAGLSDKMDAINSKLDLLISAPQETTDQHTVLDIKEASELIGKTVGTIYSLTSQKAIPYSRGNKLYFFKDELLAWIKAEGKADWMNHETGKSVKLNANDCKEMQTVLAESLGMERGTPKEDSGIEGLSSIEYKERKALENNRTLTSSLQSKYDALSKEYRSLESSSKAKIERLERERNDLLLRLKAMIEMLQEKFQKALRAFVEFSRSVLRGLSTMQSDKIVEYLADNRPNIMDAAHTLKVFARPFLDNRQFDKGSKELDHLTSNFPSVLEEVNRTQNRGFRR